MMDNYLRNKCIIFGCGGIGRIAYKKLCLYYDVVAYSDNNSNYWGDMCNDVQVISPNDLKDYLNKGDTDIYVCMENTKDVVEQLKQLGISGVRIWKKGFFYTADALFPIEFPMSVFRKKNKTEKNVLFISGAANIRDNKMAKMAKDSGYVTHLAYITENPLEKNKQYETTYDNVYPVMSMRGLRYFIDNSDFDIVHSSSEPDYLTPILLGCKVPVIHDCHDLRSSNRYVNPELLMLEYLAHTGADGVIYPTQRLREETIRKYRSDPEKSCVIENLVSKVLSNPLRFEKLSSKDNELHLVYEGGVSFEDATYKYYQKDLWIRIANEGMHIHFYTAAPRDKCIMLDQLHERIHYEGNLTSQELSSNLTKYDVGLCMYNLNDQSKRYINNASPNKLYEYVNAGIPIAVNEIESMDNFVNKYGVGKTVDLSKKLASQMRAIAEITFDEDLLGKNKLYFEDQKESLVSLYRKVLRG